MPRLSKSNRELLFTDLLTYKEDKPHERKHTNSELARKYGIDEKAVRKTLESADFQKVRDKFHGIVNNTLAFSDANEKLKKVKRDLEKDKSETTPDIVLKAEKRAAKLLAIQDTAIEATHSAIQFSNVATNRARMAFYEVVRDENGDVVVDESGNPLKQLIKIDESNIDYFRKVTALGRDGATVIAEMANAAAMFGVVKDERNRKDNGDEEDVVVISRLDL